MQRSKQNTESRILKCVETVGILGALSAPVL